LKETCLPVKKDAIKAGGHFPLVNQSDLLADENGIYFEIISCGPTDSGTDCKIRGFVATEKSVPPAQTSDSFAAGIALRSGDWLTGRPESNPIAFFVPFEAPTPPVSLTFNRDSAGRLQLRWFSPDHDGGTEVTSYNVSLTESSSIRFVNTPPVETVKLVSSTTTHMELMDISPLTVVTATVTAINKMGESLPSPQPVQLLRSDILIIDEAAPALNDAGKITILDSLGYMLPGKVIRHRSFSDAQPDVQVIQQDCEDPSLQGCSILHLLAASIDTGDLLYILNDCPGFKSCAATCLVAKDSRKRSPLLVAASHFNFEAVTLLLKASAAYLSDHEVDEMIVEADDQGNTALHYLLTAKDTTETGIDELRRYMPMFEQLAVRIPGTAKNNAGETPLIRALNFDNRAMVRCAFSDRNLHSRMPLNPRMFA
jgi:hypothetical protein